MRDLELIRAYVHGTLAPGDRAVFEARLSREPELARLCEGYEWTVRATGDVVPERETAFADLALGRRFRLPLWASAAALLLVATAVAIALASREEPAPPKPPLLALSAIPMRAVAAPPVPSFPAALADYRTSGADGLRWLANEDAARELARAAGRPLLVFVHHPQCPVCRHFRAEEFRDGDVKAAADDYVLLGANAEHLPEFVFREMPRGFPAVAAYDPDGNRIAAITGFHEAPDLARWLGRVAAQLKEEKRYPFPEWRALREAADKLVRAQRSADPAEKLALWQEVEGIDGAGRLPEVARAGRLRMEQRAQDALARARSADPGSAAAVLESAADELRGTPYAADLERVRAHLAKWGSFPQLR